MSQERSYDVTISLEYTLRVLAPDAAEAERIASIAAEFANQCVRWDELRQWQEVRPAGLSIHPARVVVTPAWPEARA